MSGKSKQMEFKRKDDVFDLEQHFILRLPPGQAMALAHEIENTGNLKDNLFVDINPDSRWGNVRYGGEVLNAKLVDLPCIIETLKTTDKRTFYKTADICQMLICSNEMEPSDEETDSPKKKKEKEKKYQYPHGITAPLKNVRRRRFRKTLKKKPIDLASIEKEVKRLLRMDMDAIDVKFEEIYEDGPPASGDTLKGSRGETTTSGDMLDEEKLFGEISSSSDEGEINIDDDSESEQMGRASRRQKSSMQSDNDDDDSDYEEMDEKDVVKKIEKLKLQLDSVEKRISIQESELHKTDDPDLQKQYEGNLEDLFAMKDDLKSAISRLAKR